MAVFEGQVRRHIASNPNGEQMTKVAAAMSNYQIGLNRAFSPAEYQFFSSLARLTNTVDAEVDLTLPVDVDDITFQIDAIVDDITEEYGSVLKLQSETADIIEAQVS
jgi:hypothetical protein